MLARNAIYEMALELRFTSTKVLHYLRDEMYSLLQYKRRTESAGRGGGRRGRRARSWQFRFTPREGLARGSAQRQRAVCRRHATAVS